MNLLRKLFLCKFGMCPHTPRSDSTGCWGECIHCGNRAGFVSREELRAYMDREVADRICFKDERAA